MTAAQRVARLEAQRGRADDQRERRREQSTGLAGEVATFAGQLSSARRRLDVRGAVAAARAASLGMVA